MSNKKPKIKSMNQQNIANLTAQYQQAYLVYCFQVMQYLQAIAWLTEQQNQATIIKVKPKSASGVKKLANQPHQQKPTLKSLKHQKKPDVSTIVAMGFPNGAMSAAFRVAFNEFGDKWDRFTGGNDSSDSPKPRILDESSRQALKESTDIVADVGKKIINTLPRPGIANTVSVDAFILGEGLAVDVSGSIITGCGAVSVCDQSGIGLQSGASGSVDFSIAFGKNFSNTTTFGFFGDIGFIEGFGISADIGFDPVELIIKIDYAGSAGAAAGLQRCTVVAQNTCSN